MRMLLLVFLQLGLVVCSPLLHSQAAPAAAPFPFDPQPEYDERAPGELPPDFWNSPADSDVKDGYMDDGKESKQLTEDSPKNKDYEKEKGPLASETKPDHPADKDGEASSPTPAFLSPTDILTRPYWEKSLNILLFHIYLPVETAQSEAKGKDKEEKREKKVAKILANVEKHVTADMMLLGNLTDEQLLKLFWKLNYLLKSGKITEDGTVIIDGKEYDLSDLISSCCPMG